MEPKPLWKSRTFWIAAVQLLAGFALVVSDVLPEWSGYAVIAKSLLDVVLRSVTDKPVKL